MLKSNQRIGINDDGNVAYTNRHDYGADENVSIQLANNEYIVRYWTGIWNVKATFATEHEAIMYGLTLI